MLTLETVVFLFHLLSTTSKPFSSLATRLAHAARLGFFYKNALYKFTVIISNNNKTTTVLLREFYDDSRANVLESTVEKHVFQKLRVLEVSRFFGFMTIVAYIFKKFFLVLSLLRP